MPDCLFQLIRIRNLNDAPASIQFDVTIAAEKDTEFWVVPTEVYKGILEESAPAANYTNELMA